jgi:hypothetical protein
MAAKTILITDSLGLINFEALKSLAAVAAGATLWLTIYAEFCRLY